MTNSDRVQGTDAMQGGEWGEHSMWVLYQLATALHSTLLGPRATARNAVPEADKLWKDTMLLLGMFESNFLNGLVKLGGQCLRLYTTDKVWPGTFTRVHA